MAHLNDTRSNGVEKVDTVASQGILENEGAGDEPGTGGTLEVSNRSTPSHRQDPNREQALHQPYSRCKLLFCTTNIV
jgi:hypothetical protein